MKITDIFKKKSSSDVAKDRLKLVLVSDRASCSPEIMQKIRSDITGAATLTAAKLASPRKRPTIIASTALYSCCRILPAISGSANPAM